MIESRPSSIEPSKEADKSEAEKEYPSSRKKKIGSWTAKEVVIPPEPSPEPEKIQSLWQRFAMLAERKELDKQLIRPTEQADNDTKLALHKAQKAKAGQQETDPEIEQNEAAPLEALTNEEKLETVRQYARTRKEMLDTQLRELPDTTSPPPESAADLAFLEFVEKELAEKADKPVEDVLDAAEAEIVTRIESADVEDDGHEEPPVAPEGEIPLRGASGAEQDAIDAAIPLSGTGGGGGRIPPTGGINGAGAAGQPNNHGNNIPPYTYMFTGVGGPPPPGGTAYVGPSSGPPQYTILENRTGITMDQVHVHERRALAQGLLLGGIIGYLIGRRRGRIKTEKRLLPIQKKLEKQVTALQATILEREQKIRRLAYEHAWALKTEEQRRRLIERLAEPAKTVSPAFSAKAETKVNSKQQTEIADKIEIAAPAMILGAVQAVHQKRSGIPMANPNRQVAAYTTPELRQAAEKVRVDGTTLKEMWDDGRLDERAVKRVITKFIEGRSVRAALNQELLENELRFEQDPKFRTQAQAVRGNDGDMATVAGATLLQHSIVTEDGNDRADKHTASANQGLEPADTNSHKKQIAVAGGIIAALIAALLVIFG
jgi:hypothetical protein